MFDWKEGRDPDFTNEEGFSWWRQKTHHNAEKAKILEEHGFSWWYVEKDDDRNFAILRKQEILKVTKGLEDAAVFMDAMYIAHCT